MTCIIQKVFTAFFLHETVHPVPQIKGLVRVPDTHSRLARGSARFNAVSDSFVDVCIASAFEVSFTNDRVLAPLKVQVAWVLGVLRLHKRQRIVAEIAENL